MWTKRSENETKSNEWRQYKQVLEIQKETGEIFYTVNLAKNVSHFLNVVNDIVSLSANKTRPELLLPAVDKP